MKRRANKARVARASAAAEHADREFRITRFMLAESLPRLGNLLNARRTSLRALYVAAVEVCRDAGALYGDTSALAELRDWHRRAKAGKRRRLHALGVWPSMTDLYNGPRSRRLRRRAERTVKWEDEHP